MRAYSVVVTLLVVMALGACNMPGSKKSLEGHVSAAMDELPYHYRLLPNRRTKNYVVLNVVNPRQKLEVTFVFGLPRKDGGCPPIPTLPPPPKGEKPAVAAGPEPLICLENDALRRGDDYRERVVRGKILDRVALALCEEVHGHWPCFI